MTTRFCRSMMSVPEVLSNAVPELLEQAGLGGCFELRVIPSADSGMSPKEIWCNEAQERYVLAIEKSHLEEFIDICTRERCPHAIIGHSTGKRHLTLTDRQLDETPIDLPMQVLFGKTPRMQRRVSSHSMGRSEGPGGAIRIDRGGRKSAAASCRGRQEFPDHHW